MKQSTRPPDTKYPLGYGKSIYFWSFLVAVILFSQGVESHIKQDMEQFLAERPKIENLFNILTLQLGPDVMVAIKAKMLSTGSEPGLLAAINKVEREFRQAFPLVAWLFFEPDNTDGKET